LLAKPYFVGLSDIRSYSTTINRTKSSWYEGVIIHLKSGKIVLLSDWTLRDYKPILRFLEESEITCLGKEKFKNIAYYRKCLNPRKYS
jgi:hypothetical protein